MTRTTSTSVLAAVFVALALAASPAMSQAAGGPGGPGGGGGGGGVGGGRGGGSSGGGWSPVSHAAAPTNCVGARCDYRAPRLVPEEKTDSECSTWRRILIGVHPRCDDPNG